MLKPTASFKMSKTTKRSLALGRFTSEQQRHDWKRAMIGAELASKVQPKTSKKDRSFTAE